MILISYAAEKKKKKERKMTYVRRDTPKWLYEHRSPLRIAREGQKFDELLRGRLCYARVSDVTRVEKFSYFALPACERRKKP